MQDKYGNSLFTEMGGHYLQMNLTYFTSFSLLFSFSGVIIIIFIYILVNTYRIVHRYTVYTVYILLKLRLLRLLKMKIRYNISMKLIKGTKKLIGIRQATIIWLFDIGLSKKVGILFSSFPCNSTVNARLIIEFFLF